MDSEHLDPGVFCSTFCYMFLILGGSDATAEWAAGVGGSKVGFVVVSMIGVFLLAACTTADDDPTDTTDGRDSSGDGGGGADTTVEASVWLRPRGVSVHVSDNEVLEVEVLEVPPEWRVVQGHPAPFLR